MKKQYLYITFLVLSVSVYIAYQVLGPKPIDWNPTFLSKDKIPYGTYIMYEELDHLFPADRIITNLNPLTNTLSSQSGAQTETDTAFGADQQTSPRNWIFIEESVSIDMWETGLLFDQVASGNDVFIAARRFGGRLADTLNIETSFSFDSSLVANFTNSALEQDSGWRFGNLPRTYFESVDTARVVVLGKDELGNPVFIQQSYGEGSFYLHSNPFAFTNFFMKDPHYATYAFKALSYLPERPTVWDEYYKAGRNVNRAPLQFILDRKPLLYGWYLGLFTVFAFFVFRAKRKQRVIPKITPPINSSIEFAKTIGSLYLEEGTHKDLFEKKLNFFLEYIRSNLNLDTDTINEAFKKNVAERSGIPENDIFSLFDLIYILQAKTQITEKELLTINQRIDRFYKESLR